MPVCDSVYYVCKSVLLLCVWNAYTNSTFLHKGFIISLIKFVLHYLLLVCMVGANNHTLSQAISACTCMCMHALNFWHHFNNNTPYHNILVWELLLSSNLTISSPIIILKGWEAKWAKSCVRPSNLGNITFQKQLKFHGFWMLGNLVE